jgi:hypothetical protein
MNTNYATDELRGELEKTARHLAGYSVRLVWEVHNTSGKCSRTDTGIVYIRLNPHVNFMGMYEIFLHETAHALHYPMIEFFKDKKAIEIAADEQAIAWALFVAARMPFDTNWYGPKDEPDLLKRLKILRSFGKERHAYILFNGKPVRNDRLLSQLQAVVPEEKINPDNYNDDGTKKLKGE